MHFVKSVLAAMVGSLLTVITLFIVTWVLLRKNREKFKNVLLPNNPFTNQADSTDSLDNAKTPSSKDRLFNFY